MVLAGVAAILLTEAFGDSVTVDEFAHLPAGLYYLRTGHFDLYRLSPPLLREIAALPVLWARPEGDFDRFTHAPEHWALGYHFMERNAVRYHGLFELARAPMVLLTLGLVGAVHGFARRHLGANAALGAAALIGFSPTVLAHGHLVGTDVGCALGVFLAAWAALAALRRPGIGRTVVLGCALGGAQLTKFSALALYPALVLLALGAAYRTQPRWRPLAVGAVAILLSLAIVNAAYLGQGSFTAAADLPLTDPVLRRVATSSLGHLPLPLPSDLVMGLDGQRAEASGVYPAYFHGTWARQGWWYYYPAALVLKETLPLLLLVLWGATVLIARPRLLPRATLATMLVPPALFAGMLIVASDINIGVRYLLPVLPFLALISAVPLAPSAPRVARRAAVALVTLHVLASVAATPHHLAYFNQLAGEPDGAYRWLVDSNLDWGQELRHLERYLAARGVSAVRLAYFGRAAPELYGIDYEIPRGPLTPGVYAVSANFLAGMPYFVWDHGTVYDVPANTFVALQRLRPSAVLGRALFVYDIGR
ncbi:MAG: glycosyltransferase family 39 protein [Candidatus Binatia bacterium]